MHRTQGYRDSCPGAHHCLGWGSHLVGREVHLTVEAHSPVVDHLVDHNQTLEVVDLVGVVHILADLMVEGHTQVAVLQEGGLHNFVDQVEDHRSPVVHLV